MFLETYSSLEGEKLQEILPKFLNIVKEVTGDPAFSMFNLSLKDDWSKTKKFCHSLHDHEENERDRLQLQQQHENSHSNHSSRSSSRNGSPKKILNGKA